MILRTTLYVPVNEPHGPNVDCLHETRKTYVNNSTLSPGESATFTDLWCENGECTPSSLGGKDEVFEWTGTTTFFEPLDLNPKVKTTIHSSEEVRLRLRLR